VPRIDEVFDGHEHGTVLERDLEILHHRR
jgi:hypothetical protein